MAACDPVVEGDYRGHRFKYEPIDRVLQDTRGVKYPMDVVESNMGYELYADVPGFRAEDITISLDANSLTVSGATERAP